MNGHSPLPTNSSKLPFLTRGSIFIISLMVVIILALAAASAWLYTQNQKLNKELTEAKTQVEELKIKGVIYLFDPKKPFVSSSVVYQQFFGKVIEYNNQNGEITLENFGEKFNLTLPSGSNATYTPPRFARVDDMYKFKPGDDVSIGGSYTHGGRFEISSFSIIENK